MNIGVNFTDPEVPGQAETPRALPDNIWTGGETAVLVNEKMDEGNYKTFWNASLFPSGINFYGLTVNEYTGIKKMVLIK